MFRRPSPHPGQTLSDGWRMCAVAPSALEGPEALETASLDWVPAAVPSTAAAVLRAAGKWSLDAAPRRFDAEELWFQCRFSSAPAGPGEEVYLCFDGLATLCDAWLNGELFLSSDNMFLPQERDVGAALLAENDLVLRFRSLDAALAARRPRPRWRVPMIERQELRYFRTSLLGRAPGWSPPAAPVGPYRPIRLERRRHVALSGLCVVPAAEGGDGWLDVACDVRGVGGVHVLGIEATVERSGQRFNATLAREGDRFTGRVTVPDAALWWPHTHGDPDLYSCRILIAHSNGVLGVDLGKVGFRKVALDTASGDFSLSVNGQRIFCRGAVWTPLDPVSLDAPGEALAAAIDQVRAAGMNMLRVSGAVTTEGSALLDRCDEGGVLVWHDLAFASMDYPEDDPAFAASVEREAHALMASLAGRPCIAVLCGNSEGEQQAAMWGAGRERWSPRLFHETLRDIATQHRPDVPYWPSSTHGGAFPHQANEGTTSYYGVGAYLRPLEDARRAELRFATECLGFANVPEPANLALVPAPSAGSPLRVHHPGWKQRAPRDLGAGWDFDDVRDHYLGLLFGVDPMRLRYSDHDRYLALSRIVPGEVMAAAFGEWRRARSTCRGALVWFLRDLWPGAGWGVIDSTGAPKAPYHYMRRALAPVALHLSDEGMNGLYVHAFNDTAAPIEANLEVEMFRGGETQVGKASVKVTVPARAATEQPVVALLDGFSDITYSYRFGRPSFDVVVTRLRDFASGDALAEAFFFPAGIPSHEQPDIGLAVEARPHGDGDVLLSVSTRRFALAVHIEVESASPNDDYFHLAPGGSRRVLLRRTNANKPVRGTVRALTGEAGVRFTSGE
jgi:beta-mannosidase